MLSEQLERNSKIGTVESILYIVHWLSAGVNNIDDLVKCIQGQPHTKISEARTILGLFELMSLIKFNGDEIIRSNSMITNTANYEKVRDWFTQEYIEFIIRNNFIDRDKISYSIVNSNYFLSPTAINPRKHACYRNLLIDLGLIEYIPGKGYIVSKQLAQAFLNTSNNKMSEDELLSSLEKQKEQGDAGEEFVLAYERNRITKDELRHRIDRISILDVSAGFDIVSFNNNDSHNFDRFIEVKTYVGKPHFHWSRNEIEKARLMGDAYYIYLVDFQKISLKDYTPLCIANPIKNIIQDTDWMKISQELLIELISVDGYSPNKYSAIKLQDGGDIEYEAYTYFNKTLETLVNTAIGIGIESIRALKDILTNIKYSNYREYQVYLKKLEEAEQKYDSNSTTSRI